MSRNALEAQNFVSAECPTGCPATPRSPKANGHHVVLALTEVSQQLKTWESTCSTHGVCSPSMQAAGQCTGTNSKCIGLVGLLTLPWNPPLREKLHRTSALPGLSRSSWSSRSSAAQWKLMDPPRTSPEPQNERVVMSTRLNS